MGVGIGLSTPQAPANPCIESSKMLSWLSCSLFAVALLVRHFELKMLGNTGLEFKPRCKNSCFAFLRVLAGFAVMPGSGLSDPTLFNYQIVLPFLL